MESMQEIHRVQRSFRAVMDAMARPGKPFDMVRVPRPGEDIESLCPSLELLITMFVDQAVTFSVVASQESQVESDIAQRTHARKALLQEAAFIILACNASANKTEEAIVAASGGTLLSPEQGATVFVPCGRIADASQRSAPEHEKDRSLYWVSVEGPGIKESHIFGIDRCDWLWARGRRNDEFPCGIEIILADKEGRVVAIPRTSFVSLLATEGEVA